MVFWSEGFCEYQTWWVSDYVWRMGFRWFCWWEERCTCLVFCMSFGRHVSWDGRGSLDELRVCKREARKSLSWGWEVISSSSLFEMQDFSNYPCHNFKISRTLQPLYLISFKSSFVDTQCLHYFPFGFLFCVEVSHLPYDALHIDTFQ